MVCLDCIFINLNWLDFRLIGCERNTFSTVTFHLNLHCFLKNLFKCLIGVFIIVSIRLHCNNGFLVLHSQNSDTLTCLEMLVVCLD